MNNQKDKTTIAIYLIIGVVTLILIAYGVMQFTDEDTPSENPYEGQIQMALPEIPEMEEALEEFDSKLEAFQSDEDYGNLSDNAMYLPALAENTSLKISREDSLRRLVDSLQQLLLTCSRPIYRSRPTKRPGKKVTTPKATTEKPAPPKKEEPVGFNTSVANVPRANTSEGSSAFNTIVSARDPSLDLSLQPTNLSGFKGILEGKTVASGDVVQLVLQEAIGKELKAGTVLTAEVELSESRAFLRITQANINGRIRRINLIGYDPMDGERGLNLFPSYSSIDPYSNGSSVGKELGGLAEQGLNRVVPGIGGIIQAGKGLGQAIKRDKLKNQQPVLQVTIPPNQPILLRMK